MESYLSWPVPDVSIYSWEVLYYFDSMMNSWLYDDSFYLCARLIVFFLWHDLMLLDAKLLPGSGSYVWYNSYQLTRNHQRSIKLMTLLCVVYIRILIKGPQLWPSKLFMWFYILHFMDSHPPPSIYCLCQEKCQST